MSKETTQYIYKCIPASTNPVTIAMMYPYFKRSTN